jgi:nicotinamidase-related amidase
LPIVADIDRTKETKMSPDTNSANKRRALIVIDVQNDYDGGGLAIEYPPFRDTVANIARAMDAAADAGLKIVAVKQLAPENAPFFAKGSRGAEFHDAVKSRKWDHLVEKVLPSAFTGSDLEEWLCANAVDTVTVVGYMTHNCDMSTIVHAMHMGFTVEFLGDASGALPYANSAGYASAEEIHRVMTVVFQSRFATVMSTAEWIEGLRTGTMPQRDSIHASNQRALARPAA